MTDFALATVKAVGDDDGPGEFEAVLSTSDLDRDGEVIDAKAFDPLPASIPIFYHHDWKSGAKPIGKGIPYYEDGVVKVKGTFASTPAGQEVRTLVTEGIVSSMSVGFLNGKRTVKAGIPHVTSGEVFEGSLTPIPINTAAAMIAAKGLDGSALLSVGEVRSREGHTKAIEGSHEALRQRLSALLSDAYGLYHCWIRGVLADAVVFECEDDTYQQTYDDDGTTTTLTGTRSAVEVHEVVVAPDTDVTTLSLHTSAGAADPAAKAAGPAVTDEAEQAAARFRLLSQLT